MRTKCVVSRYKILVGPTLKGQAVPEEMIDPQDGTDTLSRNVGTKLPFYDELNPKSADLKFDAISQPVDFIMPSFLNIYEEIMNRSLTIMTIYMGQRCSW
jgi:hypothetical protein